MSIFTSKDRIYIDINKHQVYEALRKKGSENPDNFPFHTFKDIFMLAVYIGKKNDAYSPLLNNAKEIFQGDVFSQRADVPVLAAVAFSKDPDLEKLTDVKHILEIAQNYANGGIIYVEQELIAAPGKSPLFNFVNLVC